MIIKRRQIILLAGLLSVFLILAGCGVKSNAPNDSTEQNSATETSYTLTEDNKENNSSQAEKYESEENSVSKMKVQVGNQTFTATLEDNAAAEAFLKMMKEAPVVIQMSDYSGFEKVGSLGTNLPSSNSQTTTHEGDIVLYNSNQIVIFYGSNTWSYTRLGKIDDLTGWKEALGNGDVTVTFTV